jgi:hypothetical protein
MGLGGAPAAFVRSPRMALMCMVETLMAPHQNQPLGEDRGQAAAVQIA